VIQIYTLVREGLKSRKLSATAYNVTADFMEHKPFCARADFIKVTVAPRHCLTWYFICKEFWEETNYESHR